MPENKMKEVAQLLGVELYENFRYESTLTGLSKIELRFTEKYLEGYGSDINAWFNVTYETMCNLLNGEYKVVKLPQPILDDSERRYLANVIKPFKSRIKYFYKYACVNSDYEAITAIMTDNSQLSFSPFKKGKMYKRMLQHEEYNLEMLGL